MATVDLQRSPAYCVPHQMAPVQPRWTLYLLLSLAFSVVALQDMIGWLQGFLHAPPLKGAQAPVQGEQGQAAQPTTIQM